MGDDPLDICLDDLEDGPAPEPLSARQLFLQKNPGLDPEDFEMLQEKQKKKWEKKARKMLREYQEVPGHSADFDEPPRSARKKKRKLQEQNEDPIEDFPEEEKELSAYDQHLQTLKNRKKKKRKTDGENLELDQIAREFVEEMQSAAAEDHLRVKENKPVKHCVGMLGRTTQEITKTQMIGPLLNSGLLEALRDWLVPYATGDLPPLHLREKLYACFKRMQLHRIEGIQGHFLACEERAKEEGKEGFCKVIMNLAIHKKELSNNRAKLRKLVQDWVRPLINKEIDYNPMAGYDMPQHQVQRANDRRRVMKTQAKLKRSTMARLVPDGARTRARVPDRPYFDFRKPPEPKTVDATERAVNEKQKDIMKKFQYMKNSSNKSRAQLTTVSLTGRGRKKTL